MLNYTYSITAKLNDIFAAAIAYKVTKVIIIAYITCHVTTH